MPLQPPKEAQSIIDRNSLARPARDMTAVLPGPSVGPPTVYRRSEDLGNGNCSAEGRGTAQSLFLGRLRVPHPHRLVLAARGDALAVGAEAHAPNRVGVPLEGELLLSRLRVPHLYRLITAARSDLL